MEDIIQEKISADHLLYVSLKYTKTCDVIMNLLLRWRNLIDVCIDKSLEKAKKDGKINEVVDNAIGKIKQAKEVFKKDKNFVETLDFFMMLRKLETLETERVGEFRKNVALKIKFRGEEVVVDLEKLKSYAQLVEEFVNSCKKYLSNKK